MSKFCGKCGSKINENGLCPNCNSAEISALEAQNRKTDSAQKQRPDNVQKNQNVNGYSKQPNDRNGNNTNRENTYPELPKKLTRQEKKAKKKADKLTAKAKKKADKKAKKAAKKAARTTGQKIKRFFIKLIAIILAILILFSAIAGVLVYFDIADIPVISDVMNAFGIKNDDDNEQFKSLEGKFTDISINDESSAVEAAKEAAKQMGLNNAADELTSLNTSTVDGSTYYRLQENYKGIPVYGRTMVVIADENGNAQGITSNATDIPDNISLETNVTYEQVLTSFQNYMRDEFSIDDIGELFVEEAIVDEKLVIYNLNTINDLSLAYELFAIVNGEPYKIIVDANDSDILSCTTLIFTENAVAKGTDIYGSQNISFNTLRESNDLYWLEDTERNIVIYSANNETLLKQVRIENSKNGEICFLDLDSGKWLNANGNEIVAPSTFSNCIVDWVFTTKEKNSGVTKISNDSTEWSNTKAVTVMSGIKRTYDFYKELFGRIGFDNLSGVLPVVYDNHLDGDTTNAYSSTPWTGMSLSMLTFGTDSLSYDQIAHEYTHSVESSESGMQYISESGAIMEGYSDIFGEIVEDYIDDNNLNGTCDWIHFNSRNIKNPLAKFLPKNYKGLFWGDADDTKNDHGHVHDNSTVISHTAYLMACGVNEKYEKLDMTTIAKIWYKTMLSLPSNCTFSILREYMEMTANRIGLSDAQKECIKAAFDEVGIKSLSDDKTETYSSDSEVSVFDKNGTAYDNYTIKISGKKSTGWFTSEDYNDEIVVDNSNPRKLNLSEGKYTITVSDNFNSSNTRSINVKIKENSDKKEIKFASDFGFDYTVRSGVNINVYDVNKAKYDDYTIKIEGTTDDKNSYSDSKTISDTYGYQLNLQNGHYTVTLTDNKDNSKTKSFTVRIKDSAVKSDINVETDFGKKYGQFDKSKIPSDAVEYNGHYYYIYEAKKGETDFYKAKENCESNDGYLATITSEDENKFVFTLLNKFGYKNAYFGLHDEGSNDWKWDNGETFSYSNWASGEPSSSFEDYGMYYYKYTEQWNDGDFSLPDDDGKTGYICEWGEYSVVNSEIPVTTPTRTTSSERDIVLVLDTSGSMSGTPLDETKKASTNFVDTILEEDASIGVVNYDSDADMKSDFSNSKNSLDSVISELGTGGSTNMEAGLRTADQMLSQSSAKKKIIVLMSDGMPNEGLTGDSLVSYADELKAKGIYIYTLGFFESLNDKTSAQSLMEKIASDGCHYEVSDADSLVFFFGDIADQINGQKYIYVRIACPVDVSVTYNGETLDSSETGLSTRTSFGTLTFEESDTQDDTSSYSQQTDSEESSDDRVKILRLKEGEDYDIEIEGTGRGRMNYSIGFMDENGEYTDFRKFNNIKITRTTQIDTVANVSDNTVLNVDEDGDGKYDLVYKAEANGYGEIVDYSYILYIVIGTVSAIALLVFVLVIRSKIKKRKLSKSK